MTVSTTDTLFDICFDYVKDKIAPHDFEEMVSRFKGGKGINFPDQVDRISFMDTIRVYGQCH